MSVILFIGQKGQQPNRSVWIFGTSNLSKILAKLWTVGWTWNGKLWIVDCESQSMKEGHWTADRALCSLHTYTSSSELQNGQTSEEREESRLIDCQFISFFCLEQCESPDDIWSDAIRCDPILFFMVANVFACFSLKCAQLKCSSCMETHFDRWYIERLIDTLYRRSKSVRGMFFKTWPQTGCLNCPNAQKFKQKNCLPLSVDLKAIKSDGPNLIRSIWWNQFDEINYPLDCLTL